MRKNKCDRILVAWLPGCRRWAGGVALGLLFFVWSACSFTYSFQGGRLNYDMVKTITIHEFPNRTPNYPLLSQTLDQALRKRYIEQTRLAPVNSNGDIEIEGEITGYTLQGMAVKENYESLTRLTITIRVVYTNHKEQNSDLDQSFSAFMEFDASRSIDEVQDSLVSQIIDEIVDKIYNETVANW
jgi:hypothetical protein